MRRLAAFLDVFGTDPDLPDCVHFNGLASRGDDESDERKLRGAWDFPLAMRRRPSPSLLTVTARGSGERKRGCPRMFSFPGASRVSPDQSVKTLATERSVATRIRGVAGATLRGTLWLYPQLPR